MMEFKLDIPDIALYNALNMTLLITMFVIIDILSKWFTIVDQYNIDTNRPCTTWNTFRGIFFRAWQPGYLESKIFRNELGKKARAYGLGIFMAIIVYLFPDYRFQGQVIDETISFCIYICIVIAEGFSIAENLKEMGVKEAGFLKDGFLSLLSRFGIQRSYDRPNIMETTSNKEQNKEVRKHDETD